MRRRAENRMAPPADRGPCYAAAQDPPCPPLQSRQGAPAAGSRIRQRAPRGALCRGPARGPDPCRRGGLLLLRRDHHDHLPAFQARTRLDHDVLAQVGLDPGGHLPAQFLVAHLAATEADVDLDLVALFQEAAHVAQLDLVVTLIGDRAELHFLDLDLLGLLLGLVGLLLQIELELAEVHDLADRRIRVGLDLDQVQGLVLGHAQRLVARQDADHFAIGSDHAHARDADLLVFPVLLVRGADISVSGGGLGCGPAMAGPHGSFTPIAANARYRRSRTAALCPNLLRNAYAPPPRRSPFRGHR